MSLRSLLSSESESTLTNPSTPGRNHIMNRNDTTTTTTSSSNMMNHHPPWFSSSYTGRNSRLRMPSHLLPENQQPSTSSSNSKRTTKLPNSHSSPQLGQLLAQDEMLQQWGVVPPSSSSTAAATATDNPPATTRQTTTTTTTTTQSIGADTRQQDSAANNNNNTLLEDQVQVHIRLEQDEPASSTSSLPAAPVISVPNKDDDTDSDISSVKSLESTGPPQPQEDEEEPPITSSQEPSSTPSVESEQPPPPSRRRPTKWETTIDARSVRDIATTHAYGEFESVHVVTPAAAPPQQRSRRRGDEEVEDHDRSKNHAEEDTKNRLHDDAEHDWCAALTLGLPQHLLQGHSMMVATQQQQRPSLSSQSSSSSSSSSIQPSPSSISCFQTVTRSLIPQIFQRLERTCAQDTQVTIRLSAIEVYLHHHVYDLLKPQSSSSSQSQSSLPEPRLVYHPFQNMAIWEDCTRFSCISAEDALRVCDVAYQRRTYQGNHPSARSTLVIQLQIERVVVVEDALSTTIQSTLQLVDLPTQGGHWTALQELLHVPSQSAQSSSVNPDSQAGGIASLARLASFRLPSSQSVAGADAGGGDASSSPESLVAQMLLPSVQGQLMTRILISVPAAGDEPKKSDKGSSSTKLSMEVTDAAIPQATIPQMLAVGQAWNKVETLSRAYQETPSLTKWTKHAVQLKEERYTALVQALVGECVRLRNNEKSSSEIPKQQKSLWNMIDHIHTQHSEAATKTLDFQVQSTDTKRQLQQWQATRRMLDKSLEKEMTKTSRLQADLNDLQTKNQTLVAQFSSLKEELATAEARNAELVAEADMQKWKLQTATFRESEAVSFLRQYRRFYHRMAQQVTMDATGTLSEIMETVPGMVPKSADLIDLDRCLLESGLLEPEEVGQYEQTAPLTASRAAMLKSEVQAKMTDKRQSKGNFDAVAETSLDELPRDGMEIVPLNTAVPETTSIVSQRESPYQTEARQKAYQTPAGRFICLQEKLLEDGVHKVTQKYIQLKTKMIEPSIGEGSKPRLQKSGSVDSELSSPPTEPNPKASGGFMSGIFGSSAASAASPDPSHHGDAPGMSDDGPSPADFTELRKQLSKKSNDLHSTVFKMNELLVSAKIYQTKLDDRDQHVVYLEDQLKNAQERMEILREDHASLKEQLQLLAQSADVNHHPHARDPVPLWQMGDANAPEPSLASRLVVPFTVNNRQTDQNHAFLNIQRRQSMDAIEEWSRLALSQEKDNGTTMLATAVEANVVGGELDNEIQRLKKELAQEKEKYASDVDKIILGNNNRQDTEAVSLGGDISIDTTSTVAKSTFSKKDTSFETKIQIASGEVIVTEEPMLFDDKNKVFEVPAQHTVARQPVAVDETSMGDASEILKERLMGSFDDSMTPSMAGEEDSAAMSGAYGSVRPGEGSSLFDSDESPASDESETEESEAPLEVPQLATSSLGEINSGGKGEEDQRTNEQHQGQKGSFEYEATVLRKRLEEEAEINRKKLERVSENRKVRSEQEETVNGRLPGDVKELLRAEMTKLHEKIVQMERDDVAASLRAELDEAETNAQEAWNKVRRLEDDLAEAQKSLRRLEKELLGFQNTVRSLESTKGVAEEKLARAEKELTSIHREKVELEEQLQTIATGLNATVAAMDNSKPQKKRSFLDDSSDDSSNESSDDENSNGEVLGTVASTEVLQRIQHLRDDALQSEETIRQLQSENVNLQDDLREAEERARLLEDEQDRLLSKLEESRQIHSQLVHESPEKLLAKEQSHATELNNAGQKIIELEGKIETMTEANSVLQDDLNFAHSRIARLEPFHDEIKMAEAKIHELAKELDASQKKLLSFEKSGRVEQTSEIIESSSMLADESYSQAKRMEDSVSVNDGSLDLKFREAEDTINKLREEVKELEARLEHNEPLEVQLRKSTEELLVQEAKEKSLQMELKDAKDTIQQLHEEVEDLEASSSENEALVKEMKESIETLLHLEESAKAHVESLELEVSRSKEKIQRLEEEIREANSLADQNRELTDELRATNESKDDLEQQLQEARQGISQLEMQLDEANEEALVLRTSLSTARVGGSVDSSRNAEESADPPIQRALSLSDTVKSPKDIYFANDSSQDSDSDESSVAFPRKIIMQLNEAKASNHFEVDSLAKALEIEKQKVSELLAEKKELEKALLQAQGKTKDSIDLEVKNANNPFSSRNNQLSVSEEDSESSSSSSSETHETHEEVSSSKEVIDHRLLSDILSTDEPMPKPDNIDDNDSIDAEGLFGNSSESSAHEETDSEQNHPVNKTEKAVPAEESFLDDNSSDDSDPDNSTGSSPDLTIADGKAEMPNVEESILFDILSTDEQMPEPDAIDDTDSISAEGLFEDSDDLNSSESAKSAKHGDEDYRTIDQLESEYAELEETYEALKAQIVGLESAMKNADSELKDMREQKDTLAEKLGLIKDELEEAQVREVSKLEDSFASINKATQGNTVMRLLQSEENRLVEIKDSLTSDILLVEDRMEKRQSAQKALITRKQELLKSLQDTQAELDLHTSLAKKEKKQSFLDDSSDEDSDSDDTSSDGSDDAREVLELQQNIKRIEQNIASLSTEADSILLDIESINQEKHDLQSNLSEIEGQLQNLSEQKSQAEVSLSDDSSSASDAESTPGEKSLFELTEDEGHVKEKMHDLEGQLEETESKRNDLFQTLETNREIKDKLKAEMEKISKLLNLLRQESNPGSKTFESKRESSKENSATNHNHEIAALRDFCSQLEQEKSELEDSVAAERVKNANLHQIESERDQFRSRVELLEVEKRGLEESNESLKTKVHSLESDLATLRGKEESVAPQEVDAVFSVAERTSDSDSDESNSESTEDKSGRFDSSVPEVMIELNDKLLDMESDLEGLKEKLKDAEAANKGLTSRVQTLQAEVIAGEARVLSLEKEKADLAMIRNVSTDERSKQDEHSESDEGSNQASLKSMEFDNAARGQPAFEASTEDFAEEIPISREDVDRLVEEKSELEQELAILEEECQEKDKALNLLTNAKDAMQSQYEDLGKELDSKMMEIHSLEDKLSTTEKAANDSQHQVLELESKTAELEDENNALKEKLDAAEKASDINERKEMNRKITLLESDLDNLDEKLSLAEGLRGDLQSQNALLEEELHSLHQKLMASEEAKLESQSEIEELLTEIKSLHAKVADRDKSLAIAQQQNYDQVVKFEALQKQLALSETGMQDAERQNRELDRKVQVLEKKVSGMQQVRDAIMAEEVSLGDAPKDQKLLKKKVTLLEKENEILIADLHEVREDTVKLSEGKASAELSVTQLTLKVNDLQNQLDDIETPVPRLNTVPNKTPTNKAELELKKVRDEKDHLQHENVDLKRKLQEAQARWKVDQTLASIPTEQSSRQGNTTTIAQETANIDSSKGNPRKSFVRRISGKFGGTKATSGHKTSESEMQTNTTVTAESQQNAAPELKKLETQEQANPMRIMARRFSAQGLVSRFGGKLKREGQADPITGIKDNAALLESDDPELEYDQELARKELREKLQKREHQINEKGAVVIEKFGESAPKDYSRTVFGETIKNKKIVKPKGVAEVAEEFEQRKSQSNTPTRNKKSDDEDDAAMQEFFSSRAMGGISQPTPSAPSAESEDPTKDATSFRTGFSSAQGSSPARNWGAPPADSSSSDADDADADAADADDADDDEKSPPIGQETAEENKESFDPAVLKQRFAAKAAESKPLAPMGSSANAYASSYSGAGWKSGKKEAMAAFMASGRISAPAPAPAYGSGLASTSTQNEKPKNISNHKPKSFLDDSSDDDSSDDDRSPPANPLVVTNFGGSAKKKSFLDDSSDDDDDSDSDDVEPMTKPLPPVVAQQPKKKSFLDDSSDEDSDVESMRSTQSSVASKPKFPETKVAPVPDYVKDAIAQPPTSAPKKKKKSFLDDSESDSSDNDSDDDDRRVTKNAGIPSSSLGGLASSSKPRIISSEDDDEVSAPSMASSQSKSQFVIRAGKLVQVDDTTEDEPTLLDTMDSVYPSPRKGSTGSTGSGPFQIQGGKLVKSSKKKSKKDHNKGRGGTTAASNFVIHNGKLVKAGGESGANTNTTSTTVDGHNTGKPSFKIVGGKLVTGDGGPVQVRKKKKKKAVGGKKKKKTVG